MYAVGRTPDKSGSHPARGAWIEIDGDTLSIRLHMSHPARGAWIEILLRETLTDESTESHPARGAWIEMFCSWFCWCPYASHPARGAWIEIFCFRFACGLLAGRTPQGVRGLKFIFSAPFRRYILVAPRKGCVD